MDAGTARWRLLAGADASRLELAGEWDMAARAALSDAVAAVGACWRVEIDLDNVTFIDGGGLGVVLDLARRLAKRGVEVSFGPRSRRVDRYLELTGASLTV